MSIISTDLIEKYPYIVIEGPIGSGKTTLARKFADRFKVNLLLENAEANPFLPKFYLDAQRYALPTQLFFLFQRSGQIRDLTQLQQTVDTGEKIAVLTCYDASFAAICEQAGVEVLLVGDSLGMVLQGGASTLAVTLNDMQYHTRSVAAGSSNTYIVADLPFGSYQQNREQALRSAVRLMAAGAHMIKLEGGVVMAETVRFLVERGIPVCGHLGLTPQSVHQLGGYRVQGKSEHTARQLLTDAILLAEAGAGMLVLEMIPAQLAREVTDAVAIPTIGIGAGVDCNGQVLVLHDMLGIYGAHRADYKAPRFVRNFMQGAASIQQAVADYVQAVKHGDFPAAEHSF